MADTTRRTVLAGLSATVALRPDRAFAAWPERNISLIHGLTAGGGVDVSARVIAEGLSRKLGHQIVVEPKPGAAGTLMAAQARSRQPGRLHARLDAERIRRSAPRCTSRCRTSRSTISPSSARRLSSRSCSSPMPGSAIRNIPDLIKTAKERKEPVLCGVPGAGTPQHLLIEYFSRLAGIKIQAVPFRGGNQALTDLLGKRLDFLIDPPIALIGQIKSGALQAIAVTGDKRYAPLPDVGTIAEAGFPGFSVTSWMGMAGPPKLPQEIASRLNKEINALITEPEIIERIHKLGSEPKGGTPDDFKNRIATDMARWTKVIADANIERIGG